jgi:hypothetical protein
MDKTINFKFFFSELNPFNVGLYFMNSISLHAYPRQRKISALDKSHFEICTLLGFYAV